MNAFRKNLMILVMSVIVAALYWSPALWHWSETGHGDWQQFLHQWEVARVAMLRYGELPLWNPYHCGGTLLFGDPQAQGFSPIFLLTLPLGSALGLKVFMIVHTAAGLSGMYIFARRHAGLDTIGAAIAAFVWTGSGFFAWHGSGGHPAFMPFYFTPWVLLAWRAARATRRVGPDTKHRWHGSLALAAIMSLVIFEGGVYPFPFLVLLLLFDTIVTCRTRGDWGRAIVAGAVSGVMTVLLSGFRLAGILSTIRDYPRPTRGNDSLILSEVYDMLTVAGTNHTLTGTHEYVWPEYGAYIGLIAVTLALFGFVLALSQQHTRWIAAGALLFLGFVLGNASSLHPWPVVHSMPVYSSLRVPSRFVVFFIFFAALSIGLAARKIREYAERYRSPLRSWPRRIPAFVLVAIALQIVVGNSPVIDRWRSPPLPDIDFEGEYVITGGHEYGAYAGFPARGVSTRGCYTGMTTYVSAPGLWHGEPGNGQARVIHGEILTLSRTSQTIDVHMRFDGPEDRVSPPDDLDEADDAAAQEDDSQHEEDKEPEEEPDSVRSDATDSQGVLVFNQTWAPGWQTNVGVLVKGSTGLIEVGQLPPGEHHVHIVFQPPEALLGLWISALGGVLSLLILLLGWRSRKKALRVSTEPQRP